MCHIYHENPRAPHLFPTLVPSCPDRTHLGTLLTVTRLDGAAESVFLQRLTILTRVGATWVVGIGGGRF
jgi:hypothetical protein